MRARARGRAKRRALVAASLVLLWGAPARSQDPPAATLAEALEREATPLRAELNALQRQRAETERADQAKIDALRREVEALTRRREAAWRDIADNERALRALDARLDSIPQDNDDSPLQTLTRAERRLLPDAAPVEDPAERLTRVFDRAGARIVQASRVRRLDGAPLFLDDGSRVEGVVIQVGAVASAGVTADGRGGPLVPLPEAPGAQQVIHEAGDAVAAYLRADQGGPLPVLVYDPRHPPALDTLRAPSDAAPARRERTWRDTVADAAPVGYVILGLGLMAALIALVRAAAMAHLALAERRAAEALLRLARQPADGARLDALRGHAEANDAALCRVARQALTHRDQPLDLYEASVQVALSAELGRVGRGLSALRAVAAVAPLLGLLGTVIGMIATFEALTGAGNATDPEALSGGIAQALATTQLGLMVAVPALLAYSALKGWSDRIEERIEQAAVELSVLVRQHAPPHTDAATPPSPQPSPQPSEDA